jgi:hypothetical protein
MAKKSETRWVIVGVHGLYIGQWLQRKEAIADHARVRHPAWPDRPNKDELRRLWRDCRQAGDRCVKATITWTEP